MTSDDLIIRGATIDDCPAILGFIRELAEYERLSHACTATEEALRTTLFGVAPAAEVLIAIVTGKPAGFALFFPNYSTFLAKPGIYLEDLYVSPGFRSRGIGKALLTRVAQIAVERGCGRFEWSVLNWNAPAIGFYLSLGAVALDDWTIYRVTGEALEKLGAKEKAS
jgi:GNAT superfamily N-acetyltransferase